MPLQIQKDKIPLNKISHSVRVAQAVLQYGVGAMVDFPDQTLMTAAPEYWETQVEKIHDERLEKILGVDFFGMPSGYNNKTTQEGISYTRFPEWYYCPKCRRFQPLSKWIEQFRTTTKTKRAAEADPFMIKHIKCPNDGFELVVSRFMVICNEGHIDDFPWIKWVHSQNKRSICNNPILTYKNNSGAAEGLEATEVWCETCQIKASLRTAFHKDYSEGNYDNIFQHIDKKTNCEYNYKCTGFHPWKHIHESCFAYPIPVQRGSSSVYQPITVSSLIIPPYSSYATSKIEQSKSFNEYVTVCGAAKKLPDETSRKIIIDTYTKDYSEKIAFETGIDRENVIKILNRKNTQKVNDTTKPNDDEYRYEEYLALKGKAKIPLSEYGDFVREETNLDDYKLPFLSNVTLIHKIKEIQVFTGYKRNYGKEVCIKLPETNWFPAYQVYGEGIFIEISNEMIDIWSKKNEPIIKRINILKQNYTKSFFSEFTEYKITPKFILLHTISHLLMKELSFECGYNIASLKERIYCSDDSASEKIMNGIFIYTANGDSEGTLGGLVRQGRSDVFPEIIHKAFENAKFCSNDPVCSLSHGQGTNSLNLAACYSCSLVPETSCEFFNILLDRAMIVGAIDDNSFGFLAT